MALGTKMETVREMLWLDERFDKLEEKEKSKHEFRAVVFILCCTLES